MLKVRLVTIGKGSHPEYVIMDSLVYKIPLNLSGWGISHLVHAYGKGNLTLVPMKFTTCFARNELSPVVSIPNVTAQAYIRANNLSYTKL